MAKKKPDVKLDEDFLPRAKKAMAATMAQAMMRTVIEEDSGRMVLLFVEEIPGKLAIYPNREAMRRIATTDILAAGEKLVADAKPREALE